MTKEIYFLLLFLEEAPEYPLKRIPAELTVGIDLNTLSSFVSRVSSWHMGHNSERIDDSQLPFLAKTIHGVGFDASLFHLDGQQVVRNVRESWCVLGWIRERIFACDQSLDRGEQSAHDHPRHILFLFTPSAVI
jgi:hypothetical protein